jgi:hypothetical protein
MNLDGKPDLVMANGGYDSASVYFGSQPGEFPMPTVLGTPNPKSSAIGDLNGDGRLDIAIASSGWNAVVVRLATGGGGFGPYASYFVGTDPQSVAIGDVNGDGTPDLVAANYSSNNVSVLLGTGAGSFGPHSKFNVGVKPSSVGIGDLNGDGNRDIVTANSNDNTISVLLGTGAGSFGPQTTYSVGAWPRSVAIGYVNADGILDIVTANSLSDNVSILIGTGSGSFATATSLNVGMHPNAVAIEDLNHDGKNDLATAFETYPGPGFVAVMLASGTGTFGSPTVIEVGTEPVSIAIGDLNADGNRDIVTANWGSETVSLLLGSGSGSFGSAINVGVGFLPTCVSMGDLNRDGKLDVVTANSGSFSTSILLNSIPIPDTVGVSPFGGGTPGCFGQLGMSANSIPSIGNSGFAIVGSNAPRNSVGLTLVTDIQDLQGSDLFGVNIVIHVALTGTTEAFTLDASSGPVGEQFAAVPIPNSPSLAGRTYFLQSFWVEPVDQRCTPGLGGLESSRGLAMTIQP